MRNWWFNTNEIYNNLILCPLRCKIISLLLREKELTWGKFFHCCFRLIRYKSRLFTTKIRQISRAPANGNAKPSRPRTPSMKQSNPSSKMFGRKGRRCKWRKACWTRRTFPNSALSFQGIDQTRLALVAYHYLTVMFVATSYHCTGLEKAHERRHMKWSDVFHISFDHNNGWRRKAIGTFNMTPAVSLIRWFFSGFTRNV